ncbi:MAG: MmgE/PrpD family protein [Pseudomonadota bacterium]
MFVTEKLANLVYGTQYADLPEKAVNASKQCFLDCIGVALAGCTHPIAQILESYLSEVGGNPQSTVLGLGSKTSTVNAALADGILGHALDYDDYAFPAIGHPTVTVLPAVLALGEHLDSSGKDLILAFVIGFEVFMITGGVVNPGHWYKGFHATGTLGALGAAAASCKLLSLDKAQIVNALGIAASGAAGLKQNFGTMTKPFHAGHAAETGVKAALLAKRGLTAAKDAFEGRLGFANVLTDKRDFGYLDNLGNPWAIAGPGLFFKQSPSCSGTAAGIWALESLIKEHDIKPDDVERIDAGTNPGGPEQLIYTEPKNALQAKFSMQFCLALMLTGRKTRLADFTDEMVQDPVMVDLMKRINLVVDPELTERVPLEWVDKTTRVVIRMKDGRRFERTADLKQLTSENLIDKYEECAGLLLPQSQVRQSIEVIRNLEAQKDVARLLELTTRPGG